MYLSRVETRGEGWWCMWYALLSCTYLLNDDCKADAKVHVVDAGQEESQLSTRVKVCVVSGEREDKRERQHWIMSGVTGCSSWMHNHHFRTVCWSQSVSNDTLWPWSLPCAKSLGPGLISAIGLNRYVPNQWRVIRHRSKSNAIKTSSFNPTLTWCWTAAAPRLTFSSYIHQNLLVWIS